MDNCYFSQGIECCQSCHINVCPIKMDTQAFCDYVRAMCMVFFYFCCIMYAHIH